MTPALCVALFAAAAAFGLWAGGRRRALAPVVTAACLCLLTLRVFFRYFPEVEYALLPWDAYIAIHAWWFFPCAFIALGVGARRMKRRGQRVALLALAGFVFLFALERLILNAVFDPSTCKGKPAADGVCIQSTPYTCGAAAAATLLNRNGVAADEAEMARLCRANAFTGTDALDVCSGIREKLAGTGRCVRLERSGWRSLLSLGRPAMVLLKSGFLVDHWVVVLEARPDGVLLSNPAAGRVALKPEDFKKRWRGLIVTIDPRACAAGDRRPPQPSPAWESCSRLCLWSRTEIGAT